MRFIKFICIILFSACTFAASAQRPFRIIQRDTAIEKGATLRLVIDSMWMYDNFMFTARDTQTSQWTIWRKSNPGNAYESIFNDGYYRMHLKVSGDQQEMVYVRYRPVGDGAMGNAALDSAWFCHNAIDGKQERVLCQVPEFHKNAVYDLDWSADKKRILYALGNDAWPAITRDGDIFEYNLETGTHTNMTNNWNYWSRLCKYLPGDTSFAYTQYGTEWYAWPTNVFIHHASGRVEQVTTADRYQSDDQMSLLTGVAGGRILYRRSIGQDNKLFATDRNGEHLLTSVPGFGGMRLEPYVYAATDLQNNLLLFVERQARSVFPVVGIESFIYDGNYNFPGTKGVNTRQADLNWMGRQNVKVEWSTGENSFAISVHPKKDAFYYCEVTANGVSYRDSILVKVSLADVTVSKACISLYTQRARSYQWYMNGQEVSGANGQFFVPSEGGNYFVKVTDNRGRKMESEHMNVPDYEVDSMKEVWSKLKVFPNPQTNIVKIDAPAQVDLTLINDAGAIILQKEQATELDMHNLPDGTYTIIIYDKTCRIIKRKKIVKES